MILMRGTGYINGSVLTPYRLFVILKSMPKQVFLKNWKKDRSSLIFLVLWGWERSCQLTVRLLICVAFYRSWSSMKQSVWFICNKHVKSQNGLKTIFSSSVPIKFIESPSSSPTEIKPLWAETLWLNLK